VKIPGKPVSVVQVNYAYDKALADPDALLDRYFTLTGWSGALVEAGAGRVAVVQRFHRRARVIRNGVDYIFRQQGMAAAAAACHPDVAHVNGLEFALATWRLRRVLPRSAAVVVQNHADGGSVGRAPWLRLAGRATRRAVDAFLFAAAEHGDAWRRAGFVARNQPAYCVMEASTTLRPMEAAAARAESGLQGSPALLWVGRLNANKDPLVVLDAFERSLADLPGAVLTMIYSTGELLAEVRGKIDRSPALRERVRLSGAVPHERMAAYFSAADVFLVGSHHEGSGYSLMEACACGAVPVVTDIPTYRLLTGGVIGALWTPGDAASAARALVDVGRRDLAAERARAIDRFARDLSWSAVGRRALEIYQEVLSVRGRRPEV
jgi:glycosyltransferase involved in cell wall biosynthesis